ncbi:hypothetical protein FJT64_017040 [Amphibalanus amphitrite]|uniref:Uncharacterized protein n=1 Tax=Amphibalanus amphitrite TaxID=1232801 RepID=A0A6A4X1T2_AMPAM|nr:hypothetical protein FJT64_017040 [Amphibalanus amphitrite]
MDAVAAAIALVPPNAANLVMTLIGAGQLISMWNNVATRLQTSPTAPSGLGGYNAGGQYDFGGYGGYDTGASGPIGYDTGLYNPTGYDTGFSGYGTASSGYGTGSSGPGGYWALVRTRAAQLQAAARSTVGKTFRRWLRRGSREVARTPVGAAVGRRFGRGVQTVESGNTPGPAPSVQYDQGKWLPIAEQPSAAAAGGRLGKA